MEDKTDRHERYEWEDLSKFSEGALVEYEAFREKMIEKKEFEIGEWRELDSEGLAPGVGALPEEEPDDVMPLIESALKRKYDELMD